MIRSPKLGGYKWIPEFNKKKSARVHVFVFDEKFDTNRGPIEAIEGELVFLIRQRTGQWPKYQNEIHFTNSAPAKKVAFEIYAEIQKPLALKPRPTASEKLAVRMKLN